VINEAQFRLLKRICDRGGELLRDSGASEIAEAAVVLPAVFLFIFAILWFGLAYNTWGTVTAAAREGAQYAAKPVCATCVSATTWNGTLLPNDSLVDSTIVGILQTARLNPALITLAPTLPPEFSAPCSSTSSPGYAMSTTTHNITIYRFVQINTGNGIAGNPQQCGMIIVFQYPFGSGLPFPTYPNFSLQSIMITATGSSQVQN